MNSQPVLELQKAKKTETPVLMASVATLLPSPRIETRTNVSPRNKERLRLENNDTNQTLYSDKKDLIKC